ncbi:MAG TPA: hypothetical protein VFD97_01185, partial [Acidimicrobiia bacterium]|nr:hypothetical protein [Acidimicrobiia bacterium]
YSHDSRATVEHPVEWASDERFWLRSDDAAAEARTFAASKPGALTEGMAVRSSRPWRIVSKC